MLRAGVERNDPVEGRPRDGRVARARGAVAELSEVVSPPAQQGPVEQKSAGVRLTRGDQGDVREGREHDGKELVEVGAVADLSIEVGTPAGCGAVCEPGTGVGCTAGDACHGLKGVDLLWSRNGQGADTGAELAHGVSAPAPGGAVGGNDAGVAASDREIDDIGQVGDDHRGRGVETAAVTELSVDVGAPAAGMVR